MGIRVLDHVGGGSADADFRGILVEECRPRPASAGVGWCQVWDQRSKSTYGHPLKITSLESSEVI
jgi:hypothetical protein